MFMFMFTPLISWVFARWTWFCVEDAKAHTTACNLAYCTPQLACTCNCTVPLQDLYRISRQLAAVVVPHEYGLDEQGKLLIGSKICSELLGKLLIDLESMKVGGWQLEREVEQQS
jgi:hypothetical protein